MGVMEPVHFSYEVIEISTIFTKFSNQAHT